MQYIMMKQDKIYKAKYWNSGYHLCIFNPSHTTLGIPSYNDDFYANTVFKLYSEKESSGKKIEFHFYLPYSRY